MRITCERIGITCETHVIFMSLLLEVKQSLPMYLM